MADLPDNQVPKSGLVNETPGNDFKIRGNASKQWAKPRNLTAFWLLGLTNNFAYVIMLSAAYDILQSKDEPQKPLPIPDNATAVPSVTLGPLSHNRSDKLIPICNKIGTGAILLADILPTVIIKLTAPLYMQSIPYTIRVWLVVLFGAASFPIVALSNVVALSLFGVVCASINTGLGEITFLSLMAFFDKNMVSTWSSGTGMAGVGGALSYAGLIAIGVSPRNTLFIMLVVPAIMSFSYFVLLVRPSQVMLCGAGPAGSLEESQSLVGHSSSVPASSPGGPKLSLREKLLLIPPLFKYMLPVSLVFFAEYFINQALFELIYFDNIWLTPSEQYRWYQVIYQFGVLFSRSSVNLFHIKKIWIVTIFQWVNVILFLCQVFFGFLPSVWIVFALVLFEGLFGGLAYVNTFYRLMQEVPEEHLEFSMGAASMGDSTGVALAGAVAIPIHNWFCTL